ncbi:MAG: NAD-dependent epimerase/dehydratase family protein [Patescibacteria group bacterium]
MKVLVTGGAGFIGSHIVDAYVAAGHRVAVIDNLTTGNRRNLNPKAKFYKADVRDLAAMQRIMKKERPEVVNHHAALVSVVESLRAPLATFDGNLLGTINLLLAFGEFGRGKHRRFIFASTGGAIYGEPKKVPAAETTPPDPLSPYGLSKLLAEHAIRFYAREFDFDYVIFRYTNIYGPRQNPKGEAGVVAIFRLALAEGKRPTIFGDGTKARDYLHVADVVRANVLGLRKGNGETMNLGTGRLVTDDEIFAAVARHVGFKQKARYAPYRKGEVYRISLDARRAKRVLGWTPKIKLADGIRSTVKSAR